MLIDGLDFVPIAMGLFGIAEIIANLNSTDGKGVESVRITRIWPNLREIRRMIKPAMRGTMVGASFGLLPGGGPTIGAFSAYSLEKKLASDPSAFGKGEMAGVAAPEAANNAAAQASFIPMLSLGIPPSALMALMIGAMMIHGITPGPTFIETQPKLFWSLVASMWIGNMILVLLNLPLIRVWVLLLRVPYRVLYPGILLLCCVGTYSVNNSASDVAIMAVFGFIGWMFKVMALEPAPILMGLVLGPMLEENLRRALGVSGGDSMVFLERPISASLLAISALVLVAAALPAMRRKRDEVFAE
jgi:TctA family transporter